MLYFEKSQPAPECLAVEKEKNNGSYRCGCVVERLEVDFKGKCYICGRSSLCSINVEHFLPHRGNKALKFSWDNLFYCCGHCNNVKGDYEKFDNILNCTDQNDDVENKILSLFDPFPFEEVNIIALSQDDKTLRTVGLIRDVFNGETSIKTIESASMRDQLLNEMVDFVIDLRGYSKYKHNHKVRQNYLDNIEAHLDKSSNFSSFKRSMVKKKESLMANFGHLIV